MDKIDEIREICNEGRPVRRIDIKYLLEQITAMHEENETMKDKIQWWGDQNWRLSKENAVLTEAFKNMQEIINHEAEENFELKEDLENNDSQNSALLLRAIAVEKDNDTLTKALDLSVMELVKRGWPEADGELDYSIFDRGCDYFMQQARSAINSKEGEE